MRENHNSLQSDLVPVPIQDAPEYKFTF